MKLEDAVCIIIEFVTNKPAVKALMWSYQFSTSLDALVPVWKKLAWWSIDFYGDNSASIEIPTFETHISSEVGESCKRKTIQEAACIATAKAIQELKA